MPKKKHLYIFIGGSKRSVGNHVLGFGEGWCADVAYNDMLSKDPYQRGVPAHGWRLADSAEAIPVKFDFPAPKGRARKKETA